MTNRKPPSNAFKPGQSGNPAGKPKGTRSKSTQLLESLLHENAEAITDAVIQQARGGNRWSSCSVMPQTLKAALMKMSFAWCSLNQRSANMTALGKRLTALETKRDIQQMILSPGQKRRIFEEVCIAHGIDPSNLLKSCGSFAKAVVELGKRFGPSEIAIANFNLASPYADNLTTMAFDQCKIGKHLLSTGNKLVATKIKRY